MDHEVKHPVSSQRRAVLKTFIALSAGGFGGSALARHVEEKKAKAIPRRAKLALGKAVQGTVLWRGDADYESARGAAVYRENKPKRFPEVIVLAESDKDVMAAVRFARDNGLKVGRRSGGHSWTSPHIRGGSMLIDLSRMQDVTIDAANRTLWTNPGVVGSRINAELNPLGLIIPTAHHPTVGIGGFSMCGGFGWNSRLWGNGSEHILAIDVVNANGELIRADETQNSDYLWAARGAGAGFFGVVTRMQLKAHPLPPVMKASVYSYTADVLEELFTWARNLVLQVPPYMELVIVSTAHDATGAPSPVKLTVAALALTDTEEQADQALALLETCPVVSKATFRLVGKKTNLDERYASGYSADPKGYRFGCDNIYTNASAEELVPKLRKLFTDLPSPRSHVFWLNWGPQRQWPDMALSVQADVFLGAYSIWDDPAQDEAMERWPVEQMKELESLSVGGQMNDENMLAHPQRYLSPEAGRKLEALRAKHDPKGVFLSYLIAATNV